MKKNNTISKELDELKKINEHYYNMFIKWFEKTEKLTNEEMSGWELTLACMFFTKGIVMQKVVEELKIAEQFLTIEDLRAN